VVKPYDPGDKVGGGGGGAEHLYSRGGSAPWCGTRKEVLHMFAAPPSHPKYGKQGFAQLAQGGG